jgi:hypothetical protein
MSGMRLLAISVSLLSCCQAQVPEVAVEDPRLARIVVIGSSASKGWNTNVGLHDALEAQLLAPHAPIVNFADEMFFLDPGSIGEQQVDRAREHAPSLVVAVDFLFWFGYGEVRDESERLENLELGLELLDSLDCPLLISRFPDMSPAIGRMLLPTQMPEKATLARLNTRTQHWAEARGRTAFVPMPELLDLLRDGELVCVAEQRFQGAQDQRRLLQADNLHPTPEGVAALARVCIDTLIAAPFAMQAAAFHSRLGPALASLRELDQTRAAQLRAQGKTTLRPTLAPDSGRLQLK